MTREQAMEYIECGDKITHESFKPKEYLKLRHGEVVDEKGKICTDAFFNKDSWQDGWSIFEPKNLGK